MGTVSDEREGDHVYEARPQDGSLEPFFGQMVRGGEMGEKQEWLMMLTSLVAPLF